MSASTSGHLARESALLGAAQIAYKVLGIAWVALASRRMPAEELGAYLIAFAVAEALTALTQMGTSAMALRELGGRPEQVPGWLGRMWAGRIVTAPLYLTLATAGVMVAADWPLGWSLLLALSLLAEDLYFSYGACFLALHRASWNVSIGVVCQLVHLALVWALAGGSAEALVWANVARAGLLIGAAGLLVRARLGPWALEWDSDLLRRGVPFAGLSLVGLLRGRLDSILLGLMAVAPAAAAPYQLAARVIVAGAFVPWVVLTPLTPVLGAQGATARARELTVRGALVTTLAGGAAMVGLMLFPWPAAALLFGPHGEDVVPWLVLLGLVLPWSWLDAYLGGVWSALGGEWPMLRVHAAALVAGGALGAAAIHLWGVHGAVVGAALLAALRLVPQAWSVWRLLHPGLRRAHE